MGQKKKLDITSRLIKKTYRKRTVFILYVNRVLGCLENNYFSEKKKCNRPL